jgi:hypothetical protein
MTTTHARTRLAALAAALLASGCARRVELTPAELTRIEARDGLATLRVFPDQKLISLYRQERVDERYEVDKHKITERGEYRPLKRIVASDTPGKIVARTELNGMPVLWVAFDNACADTACAYAFALTEVGKYQLIGVPERDGFQPPENFRRSKLRRNLMTRVKQRSLADANPVLAVTRGDKVLTVDLTVRKDRYRPTRTDVERAGGAD